MADNQFINFNSQDVADMYRRNQYARMLQDQAAAPIERSSYKGIEADIHPMQGVAKLTAALLAGYQQNRMDKSYANEKAAAEQKLVAEQERRRGEVAAYGQGFGPETAYTNAAGGDVNNYTPQTQMTSTPRSPAQLLAHELSGMGSDNELIRNMARASSERRGAEAQEKTRLDERAQNRLDKDAEIKRLQGNADRTYGLQLEKLRQDKLPTKADMAVDAAKAQDNLQKSISTQEVLNGAVDLFNHPGRKAATGASSVLGMIPGTEAKGFAAKLETFNAQTFLPMVSALKGMGALSDAEGKKLSAAVGALDRGMPEEEFANSLKGITQYLYKKGKAAGLDLTEPDFSQKSNNAAELKSVMDMYAPKGK